MSHLIYGIDEHVSDWVKKRLVFMSNIDFGDHTAIGVVSDSGKMMAGVVYHDFRRKHRTISISMAADNPLWATKKNIADLLGYPFNQLNVFKIWIATHIKNEHGLKTFNHIGFTREAVLAHQFGPGEHCVMQRMLLKDYNKIYGDK